MRVAKSALLFIVGATNTDIVKSLVSAPLFFRVSVRRTPVCVVLATDAFSILRSTILLTLKIEQLRRVLALRV